MSEATFELGGQRIQRMGFGAMQLPGPGVWGPPADRDAAIAVLRRAVELGVDHIDTAQFYGPDVANDLIRDALHPYPQGLLIVTKVGARRDDSAGWFPAHRPEDLRASVEDNLRSLRLERLPVVNLRLPEAAHAADDFSLEEALGTLIDLRAEGKLELIGLSSAGVDELATGRALTDIVCVQNHYNVFDRNGADVVEACAGAGIAFVPFFPLGSAFAGGPARLAADPVLRAVADRHDATPAQIALAWLLHVGSHVLLIPGTSSVAHLEENLGAAGIALTADDLAELDDLA